MEKKIQRISVSDKGKSVGLFIGLRMSKKGTEYEDLYYNEDAQRMIVEWFIRKK